MDEKTKFYLENIKKSDKASFLNNSNTHYWDANDDYIDRASVFPNLIKVTRRKKCGILEFNYTHNPYDLFLFPDTIQKRYKKEIIYFPEYIEGKTILPIHHDSIVWNDEDGLIYFYRKNKVGIYPFHKTVQFEYLRKKTNSFYSVIRDDKKGWLDVKTNTEYYD